jgi:HAE1 family hydrophobic/amphiphilic exporter-1
MQLTEVFIKRPISTIVLNLFLVAIGMILATKLETRNNPTISLPYVTVTASCPNTSAAYMEKRVAQYIENELKTIPNLESISSTSFPEHSNIKLAFKFNSNIDNALNNVRDKIFNVSNYLPEDTKVGVNRVDIDARPSIYLSITTDKHDDLALTQMIDKELVRPLSRLESVGSVEIMGGRYYTMYIEPVSTKMLQYKLTPLELGAAVRSQNNDYSIGQIKDKINNFSVKVNASLSSVEEFKNIIIKTLDDGTIIKLGDVANVELKSQDNTFTIRHNQEKALLLGIIKATNASVIDLSDKVKNIVAKIQTTTCEGITIKTFYDESLTVKSAINSVYKTIFESIVFVGIITFLFFASFRITLIPLIAIPISLIATFSAMYACGFSINTFTLLAMVLATGLVVDDAIVMLENIVRHTVELKKPTLHAAVDGAKEIYFAIIAMTLTLSAVFLPVGFLDNFIGKLFIEFAWTLSFCILFSGIVSLTLTPLMCAKFINADKMQAKRIKPLELFSKLIIGLQAVYAKYLNIALNNKKKLYLICLISTLTLIFSFLKVKKTFGPIEDYGAFRVNFQGPQGFSIDDTDLVMKKAENIFSNIKSIEGYLTVSEEKTKNGGFGIIVLTDWSKRNTSQEQIRKHLNQKLGAIPEMSVFARNFPSLVSMGSGNSDATSIEFHVLSSLEYNELYKISKSITDKMEQENNVFNPVSIETNFDIGYASLELIINKEKAYQYNLEIANIIKTIQYLIGGQKIGDFTIGSNIYKVYMQYKLEDRNKVNSLHQIYIKDSKNGFVPLGSVAEIVETSETRSYYRYNNLRSIKISANLTDKADKKQAKSIITSITANLIDTNTTKLEYIEKEAKELAQSTLLTFGFALLFIFLILSAQFESFLSAILILMAVPFSIVGAILALLVFKDSLNLYSGIGLITLIGLITKNSIMLVEFANQLVKQGMSVKDAVLESAQLRLRPILMTTLSTICGALPLIFTTGASAGACRSIGITIVGGMAVGSIFTSFIIPALYLTFNKRPRN